jgi:hypothetical protein
LPAPAGTSIYFRITTPAVLWIKPAQESRLARVMRAIGFDTIGT